MGWGSGSLLFSCACWLSCWPGCCRGLCLDDRHQTHRPHSFLTNPLPPQYADAAPPPAADGADADPAAPPRRVSVSLLVSQQNPIFAALLQHPREAVAVTVERPDVAKVMRTAAALNLVLARQNGAGSVLVMPTELEAAAAEAAAEPEKVPEAAAAEGEAEGAAAAEAGGKKKGGEKKGDGPAFALRFERVPPNAPLPRDGPAAKGLLYVRSDARPDRLAATIVDGVVAGDARRLEVRDAKLLPLALQGIARARARLAERGSGLDLAAVVQVARRQQQEPKKPAAAGAKGAAAVAAPEDEAAPAEAEAAVVEGTQEQRLPRGRLGPPVYTFRLVTLQAAVQAPASSVSVSNSSKSSSSGGGSKKSGGEKKPAAEAKPSDQA